MTQADGWITIGTKLDTSDLEKQYNKLVKELENKSKEAETLTQTKAKIEIDLQEYERQKQLIEESTNKTLEQAQTQEQVNWILESEKVELEELNSKYSTQFEKINNINDKINENANSQEILKQKISEANAELNKSKGFFEIKGAIDNIGNSIEGVIRKITRWGLAIFGIRSAYLFVRQAMSTLSQYNEQIAIDTQYLRFVLASTLQPVIERIIKLVYTLLQYIGYIAKAWFGVNIFANASVKAFQKSDKSLGGSVKNAKQLNKELNKSIAGFDEMNVLQDNTSTDSGGAGGGDIGGAGGGVPSMDLSKWDKIKVPKWIEWIAKNKDLVLGFFLELALIIGAIKLAKFLSLFGLSGKVIAGIVLIVAGLIIFIKGIIDYLKNPTWKNFATILAGIGVIALGVLAIFGGFPALITLIVGLIIALGLAIYKNWDSIKKTLSQVAKWIDDHIIKPVAKFFKGLWDGITNGVKNSVNNIKKFFNSIPSFFSGIVNKIKSFFSNLGHTAGNVIAGAFKSVVNGVLRTIENILNTPIKTINSLIGTINKISPVKIDKLSTFSLPRLAKGGIINLPSRGVPIGNAIAGERGAEGVIPLTDSQQMALLGEAIGKYVTINLTNVNQMNGRVISREIQKVQNQSNFAMNR